MTLSVGRDGINKAVVPAIETVPGLGKLMTIQENFG